MVDEHVRQGGAELVGAVDAEQARDGALDRERGHAGGLLGDVGGDPRGGLAAGLDKPLIEVELGGGHDSRLLEIPHDSAHLLSVEGGAAGHRPVGRATFMQPAKARVRRGGSAVRSASLARSVSLSPLYLPLPFTPRVREWFEAAFAQPTPAQAQAWPAIASGEHVLVSAPTGSGKTLAAFLWGLDRLAAEPSSERGTRLVYVSPLKALSYDIERNLRAPLKGISGPTSGPHPPPPERTSRWRSAPATPPSASASGC